MEVDSSREDERVAHPEHAALGDVPRFKTLPSGRREHLVSRHDAKPGMLVQISSEVEYVCVGGVWGWRGGCMHT